MTIAPTARATEIAADVWEITVPTGFSPPSVNCVLLKGEPLTLFDCGLDAPAAVAALRTGLAQAGVRPRDIEVLVLSHFHVDHAGWAAPLQAESGCRILAHANTALWLKPGAMEQRSQAARRLMQDVGTPPEVAAESEAMLHWLWSFGHPVHVDAFLNDGETVRLGSRDWTVVHTPGHAYGLISLWQPEEKLLLASDHLIRDVSSNAIIDPVRPGETRLVRSLPLYRAALQRVADLPAAVVLCGHAPSVTDHAALVSRRLQQQSERAAALVSLLQQRPQPVWALAEQLFPRLQVRQAFLAVSEVLGHLYWLEDEGRARPGGDVWHATEA